MADQTAHFSLYGWVALATFSAWLMGGLVEDIGRPSHAYTLGWGHLGTLAVMIAWPAVCGYLIGRGHSRG